MRSLMVLGCTSDAGKSLLATALCRWFARHGVDVAPFKAQNMSNNARVVDGGEIGVAQWLQARAAGVEPTTDMNPVLVKPEAETRSQVVVQGRARPDLRHVPWVERAPLLWDAMAASHDRLAATHDLVVIEGAGSPAEINLPDLVNRRMLAHADAAAILAVDIDRGGAFAHLVGTWSLVDDETRVRLAGFVLNRFRGDASLLAPAPAMVTERTGMAHLGVVPMLDHRLPDEEGATVRAVAPQGAPTVAVLRFPWGSNLDEWHLLPHAAHLRWASCAADLDGVDVVILPGSKHVAADVAWMRQRGLDRAVTACADAGTRILGVCGGAMALGTAIADPAGIEGAATGVGLVPLHTVMARHKTARRTTVRLPALEGAWSALGGLTLEGYEIRHGAVTGSGGQVAPGVWLHDNVLATTVHGLFEHPTAVAALTGVEIPPVLEQTFELLADAVEAHLDTAAIATLVGM